MGVWTGQKKKREWGKIHQEVKYRRVHVHTSTYSYFAESIEGWNNLLSTRALGCCVNNYSIPTWTAKYTNYNQLLYTPNSALLTGKQPPTVTQSNKCHQFEWANWPPVSFTTGAIDSQSLVSPGTGYQLCVCGTLPALAKWLTYYCNQKGLLQCGNVV